MTRGTKIAGICLLAGISFAGGMFVHRESPPNGAPASAAQERKDNRYTCPMHPFIERHTPGACPICGMELVRNNPGRSSADKPAGSGEIGLTPAQQVMANLATERVEPKRLIMELAVAGIVTYRQQSQAKIATPVAGRIDRLHVGAVGDRATTEHAVAEIFSPELGYAEEEYLLAWNARKQFANSTPVSFSQGSEALMFAARDRLRLLGFKEPQFAQLERLGRAAVRIPVYSPIAGTVIEKLAIEGEYINAGTPLFTVADLSTVWVEASVYENEFPFAQAEQQAEITSPAYPGRTFSGRVSFIYPFLDQKTRSVRVRIELANPGLLLKPDMFVNVRLTNPFDAELAIPVSSVIDRGKHQVVWVETKPGVFSSRKVTLGSRANGYVQILAGLQRGERVATSGGYLIDSEAQFREKAAGPPSPR